MCNAEAPSVEGVVASYDGKLDIVGVAWSGDKASYQTFVDKYHLSFPQALDTQGELFAHFSVPSQPAWVFIDRDGKALRHLGAMEPAALVKAFEAVLH